MTFNDLTYARQFLLSPIPTDKLPGWKHTTIGDYNIYSHPFLNAFKSTAGSEVEAVLLGFVVNPHEPDQTDTDILNDIIKDTSIPGITNKLYRYAGRFVLVIKHGDQYYIFHDACGLRTVCYTKYKDRIFAASQALLLKKVMPLTEGKRYQDFFASAYAKVYIEYYLPTGYTLYEEVFQLTPNHYLDFNSYSAIRYWPTKQLQKIDIKEGVVKAGELLRKTILAFHKRFKLALPVTAGFDSRILLSACKPIAKDLFFFTFQYRTLEDDSMDIRVPRKLLSKLGFKHHVVDCRNKGEIDPAFAEMYKNNSEMSHYNDWGHIAYGMLGKIPDSRVVLKGSCAEIIRCAYYMTGKPMNITKAEQILSFEIGWEKIDFIKQRMTEWLVGAKKLETQLGYDVMDLFYWELRMGSWQAQSQLEWDLVYEEATPFNNRELLDIGLGISNEYKCKPHFQLFPMIAGYLWKETLSEPINPRPFYHKLKVLIEYLKRQLVVKRS